jgi:hypothetical protein
VSSSCWRARKLTNHRVETGSSYQEQGGLRPYGDSVTGHHTLRADALSRLQTPRETSVPRAWCSIAYWPRRADAGVIANRLHVLKQPRRGRVPGMSCIDDQRCRAAVLAGFALKPQRQGTRPTSVVRRPLIGKHRSPARLVAHARNPMARSRFPPKGFLEINLSNLANKAPRPI